MYNENASFRHVFLQIPCKPSRSPRNEFHTSKVYRYTNGGVNASCLDSSQPWQGQNTSWTYDTNHLVILTSISVATNPPIRLNYAPKWVTTTTLIQKQCFCIKLLHGSAPKGHHQARMCEKSVMYTWPSHFSEINQNFTYSPHILPFGAEPYSNCI